MQSPSSIRPPPLPGSGSSGSQAGGGAGAAATTPSQAGQSFKDFPFPPLSSGMNGTGASSSSSNAAHIPLLEPRIQPLSFRIPLLQHRYPGAASNANAGASAATGTSVSAATASVENPELDRLRTLKEKNAGLHLSHSSPSTAPTPVMQANLVTSETWKIRWACFIPTNSPTSPTTSMQPNLAYPSLLHPSGLTSFAPSNGTGLASLRRSGQSTTHSASTTPNDTSTPGGGYLNLKSSRTRPRADSSVSTGSRKKPRTSAVSPFATQASSINQINPQISRLLNHIKTKDAADQEAILSARDHFLSDLDSTSTESGVEGASTSLPSKLAYIDSSAGSDGPPVHTKLWLFTLVVDQDMDVDIFGSPAGLEMHLSGTFARQDLFPTLYNDNSIYIAPSSRPCRNFASCLQVSAATNQDAINASRAFSSAVSNYLLEDTKRNCRPDRVGPAVKCGSSIIWPSINRQTPGLSLSYNLHFDFDGMVATAHLELCNYRSFLPSPRPLDDLPSIVKNVSVTLCPLAVEAKAVRFYGKASAGASFKKQALSEASEIPALKASFLRYQHGKKQAQALNGLDEVGEDWILCSYDDIEIVWPAAFCLAGSGSDSSENPNSVGVFSDNKMKSSRTHKFRPSTSARSIQSHRYRSNLLAEKTSTFIEKAAKDRERERRERAEKAIAANAANSTPGHSRSQSLTQSISAANMSTPPLPNASPIFGGSPGTNFAGYFTPADSSIMSPTFDSPSATSMVIDGSSVSQAPSLATLGTASELVMVSAPPLPKKPSAGDVTPAAKRSKWAAFNQPVTLAGLVAKCPAPLKTRQTQVAVSQYSHANGDITGFQPAENGSVSTKDNAVYPTPQSTNTVGSTTSEQVTTTATTNSGTNALESSKPASASFNDVFDDFLWTSYPSADISFHADSKSGNGDKGNNNISGGTDPFSFGDSDMGMFDAGLTEDDFSFFDTPAMPSAASLPSLPDQMALQPSDGVSIPPVPHTAPQLPSNISFSDFITSQGPIDHFGHLMPTGNSPASGSLPSTTSPNFLAGDITANPLILATPAHNAIQDANQSSVNDSPSFAFSGNDFLISPEHQASQSQDAFPPFSPVVMSGIQESSHTPYNSIVEIVDGAEEHPPPKYLISPPKHGDNTTLGKNRRLLKNPDFAPLHFDEHESNIFRISYTEGHSAVTQLLDMKDLLAEQRKAKAAILRSRLRGKTPQTSAADKKLYRNWSSLRELASLPFGDTSSSSSSSSSEDEGIGHQSLKSQWTAQASLVTKRVLGPMLLMLTGTFEKIASQSNESRPPYNSSVDKVKLSKSEREALATVFFQQYLENADLRQRIGIESNQLEAKSDEMAAIYMIGRGQNPLAFAPVFRPQPAQRTNVTVYYHSAVMRMSRVALSFWEKMGLKPHSGEKDVRAYFVAPSCLINDGTREAITSWFERLSKAYKTCGLGNLHRGLIGGDEPGDLLHILDCPNKTLSQVTDIQEKLQGIGSQIVQDASADSHTIIYVLLTDQECRRPNSLIAQLCLRLHLLKRGLIPHLVPLSALSRQSAIFDAPISSHRTYFTRLAFTVYDRLPVPVQRHTTKRLLQLTMEGTNSTSSPQSTRVCPAPAFRLAPQTKPSINFTLQWPASSLDILDRHRLFHIAYSISADGRWLFLAAIDERAEYHSLRARFVEGLDLKFIIKRIWNFAKEVTEPVNVEWRISIVKAESMPVAEVQAWNDLLQSCIQNLTRAAVVTVSCIGPLDDCALLEPTDTSVPANKTEQPPASGPKIPQLPDMVYDDQFSCPKLTVSRHPTPVYTQSESTGVSGSCTMPRRKALYCSLSTATARFAPKVAAPEISSVRPSQIEGYSLHLLLTASHASSTYIQPLSRHLQEVIQSFVDLHTIARERWSLQGKDHKLGGLPWHVAAVTLTASYDIESLFPTA